MKNKASFVTTELDTANKTVLVMSQTDVTITTVHEHEPNVLCKFDKQISDFSTLCL